MLAEKIFELIPIYVEQIPLDLEEGKLYVSDKFGITIHLCACGCKVETICNIQPHWDNGWKLTKENDLITLRPSIGNFNGEKPYHAHYYITKNKIKWLK